MLGNIPASVFLLFGFAAICHVIPGILARELIFLRQAAMRRPPDCPGSIQNRTRVIAYGITGVGAALAGLVMLARQSGAYSRPGI